jgi:uncharacterized membrane protein
MALIAGAGIGAGLMYLLDPDMGRRRRALTRDQIAHGIREFSEGVGVTSRDLMNRSRGVAAEMRHLVTSDTAGDEVLVQRVRSAMGGVVGHPGSIHVTAHDGHVILRGVILEDEVDPLIKRASSVRGVKSVEEKLEIYKEPGNIPGLQGMPARRLAGDRFELMQNYWSPTARLLTGVAGSVALMSGLERRDVFGATIAASGFMLLMRALTNMEMSRLFGVGAGSEAIHIQKTIRINAPIKMVFDFFSDYENFPRFMRNVREIRKIDDKRSHWVVSGPAGANVEWDSILTSNIPEKVLAWKTESGSVVQHAGILRFQPNPDGSTTVDIKLSYNPVAGGLGHLVASVFGSDPKTLMDDELMRMKSFIETGVLPRDVAQETGATAGR